MVSICYLLEGCVIFFIIIIVIIHCWIFYQISNEVIIDYALQNFLFPQYFYIPVSQLNALCIMGKKWLFAHI